jgi:hypothetical protein
MKNLLILAENPLGNTALLEEQLFEAMRKYLSYNNKKCLVKSYEGMSMDISEASDKVSANYILEISLKEKND